MKRTTRSSSRALSQTIKDPSSLTNRQPSVSRKQSEPPKKRKITPVSARNGTKATEEIHQASKTHFPVRKSRSPNSSPLKFLGVSADGFLRTLFETKLDNRTTSCDADNLTRYEKLAWRMLTDVKHNFVPEELASQNYCRFNENELESLEKYNLSALIATLFQDSNQIITVPIQRLVLSLLIEFSTKTIKNLNGQILDFIIQFEIQKLRVHKARKNWRHGDDDETVHFLFGNSETQLSYAEYLRSLFGELECFGLSSDDIEVDSISEDAFRQEVQKTASKVGEILADDAGHGYQRTWAQFTKACLRAVPHLIPHLTLGLNFDEHCGSEPSEINQHQKAHSSKNPITEEGRSLQNILTKVHNEDEANLSDDLSRSDSHSFLANLLRPSTAEHSTPNSLARNAHSENSPQDCFSGIGDRHHKNVADASALTGTMLRELEHLLEQDPNMYDEDFDNLASTEIAHEFSSEKSPGLRVPNADQASTLERKKRTSNRFLSSPNKDEEVHAASVLSGSSAPVSGEKTTRFVFNKKQDNASQIEFESLEDDNRPMTFGELVAFETIPGSAENQFDDRPMAFEELVDSGAVPESAEEQTRQSKERSNKSQDPIEKSGLEKSLQLSVPAVSKDRLPSKSSKSTNQGTARAVVSGPSPSPTRDTQTLPGSSAIPSPSHLLSVPFNPDPSEKNEGLKSDASPAKSSHTLKKSKGGSETVLENCSPPVKALTTKAENSAENQDDVEEIHSPGVEEPTASNRTDRKSKPRDSESAGRRSPCQSSESESGERLKQQRDKNVKDEKSKSTSKNKKKQDSLASAYSPSSTISSSEKDEDVDFGKKTKPRNKKPIRKLPARRSVGRTFWTEEEEKLLVKEVKKHHHKKNCMAEILTRHGKGGTKSETFAARTSVMLKDKAVNLSTKWKRERRRLSRKTKAAFERFPPKRVNLVTDDSDSESISETSSSSESPSSSVEERGNLDKNGNEDNDDDEDSRKDKKRSKSSSRNSKRRISDSEEKDRDKGMDEEKNRKRSEKTINGLTEKGPFWETNSDSGRDESI